MYPFIASGSGAIQLFLTCELSLDVGSYLSQKSAKSLTTAEKQKKYKCLQPCLESWHSFTPMVYSVDGILGIEDVAPQRRPASLFCNKLKLEYLEMCEFVIAGMSLVIVRSNTLLLRGVRDKEAYIQQIPNMEDGVVMELLALWQG